MNPLSLLMFLLKGESGDRTQLRHLNFLSPIGRDAKGREGTQSERPTCMEEISDQTQDEECHKR